jgi:hypothetical protein
MVVAAVHCIDRPRLGHHDLDEVGSLSAGEPFDRLSVRRECRAAHARPGSSSRPANENDLAAELEGTIGSGDITGNVLTGVDTSGVGDNGVVDTTPDADGNGANHIYTFSHDGSGSAFDVAFSWDGVSANALSVGGAGTNVSVVGHVVSFDTEFGRMVFNMETGGYTFTPGSVTQTENVVFHYGTKDADGDTDLADAAGGDGDDDAVPGNSVAGGADLVITINNVNHAPVANDDGVIPGSENDPIIIDVATLLGNDSDPDSDLLSILSVQGGVNGTATLINGNTQVQFVPTGGYSGPASFTYTIKDPAGLTGGCDCQPFDRVRQRGTDR